MATPKTYTYKIINNHPIHADVYHTFIPNSPAIIYIHGGGLIWGTRKSLIPEQIHLYNQAGYTVISIDYRLAPETLLPAIISDVKDALHWVRTQCDQLSIDPDRIAIIGSSAGGYLSLMTGIFPEKPKAIVSFYGYGDILADWYLKPNQVYLQRDLVSKELAFSSVGKETISEGELDRFLFYLYCRQRGLWTGEVTGYDLTLEKAKIRPFCPVHNITPEYPPTLLLHGDQDLDVPYEQSVQMSSELTKHGINNQLIILKDAGHVFDKNMNNPEVGATFNSVLNFLKKWL